TVPNEISSGVTATSALTSRVLDKAPTVTTPTISGLVNGLVMEGTVVTASASAGASDDAITYNWYWSGDKYTNPIGTASTVHIPEWLDNFTTTTPDGLLTITEEHALEVKATVTNDDGVSATAASLAYQVLDAFPTVTTPVISGNAQDGQTLTVSAS